MESPQLDLDVSSGQKPEIEVAQQLAPAKLEQASESKSDRAPEPSVAESKAADESLDDIGKCSATANAAPKSSIFEDKFDDIKEQKRDEEEKPVDPSPFRVGDYVFATWKNGIVKYEAKVIGVDQEKVRKVHGFLFCSLAGDSWVCSGNLRAPLPRLLHRPTHSGGPSQGNGTWLFLFFVSAAFEAC